jgi:hypothetical protein
MNVDELKPGDVLITASGLERKVANVAHKSLTLKYGKRNVRYSKNHPTIAGAQIKASHHGTNGNGNGKEVEPELLLPKCAHQFILAYYATHPEELVSANNVIVAFATEVHKVLR